MNTKVVWNFRSCLLVVTCFSFGTLAHAAVVESIDFKVNNGSSEILLKGNEPLDFQVTENPQDKQVIVDLKGATLGPMASRSLDTSSFNSPVTLISPYTVDAASQQVRIVIQLREMGGVQSQNVGTVAKLLIGGGSAPEKSETPVAQNPAAAENAKTEEPTDGDVQMAQPIPGTQAATNKVQAGSSVEARKLDDRIGTYLENKETRNFSGSRITLQVKDADIRDVLRLIGEASGFNIIIGAGVTGSITLSLVDVPWDQALDVVLNTMGLGAERNRNILRVLTLTNLTQEKQALLQAKAASEATAPRITRIFPVSYAEPGQLREVLMTFGKSATGQTTTVIQVDPRTNSIIVQDIPNNLERMAKLIEILDTQTPQVLVESKIVEATEEFSSSMGGNLGFGQTNAKYGQYVASFNGGNPLDALVGSPGVFADGGDVAGPSSVLGFSPNFGFLPRNMRLNAILTMAETESLIKVVSSPKAVVLNKSSATILETDPVIFTTTTIAEGAVTAAQVQQNANISLNVTPTVTNDESVLMDLKISRDVPVQKGTTTAIALRNIQTKVLVDSGSTLVIGGIFVADKTKTGSGFPFFRKIPILGMLFGSDGKRDFRSELFIFVTPKILNTKRAGLSS